ncbi:MAG TPA: hypothetical protein VHE59_04795 [Mucilaginibacter sp.]|nr:hypothetical protein [Mucilaginibacter sp.]
MKNSVLLPAIIGLLCLAACRKESSRLTGRWQKVKLKVYNQNTSTGVITRDTTSANFGPLDYAEFSGDNKTFQLQTNTPEFIRLLAAGYKLKRLCC